MGLTDVCWTYQVPYINIISLLLRLLFIGSSDNSSIQLPLDYCQAGDMSVKRFSLGDNT